MKLDAQQIQEFQKKVYDFYELNVRSMPWRDTIDPYYVLVSEMMLQQTQVSRVIPKFNEFIGALPSINDLAEASQSDVVRLWSGLGYNRRARFLHQSGQIVRDNYDGVIPRLVDELVKFPGIGPNTAGAICAYAWNAPVVFVETNIRSVMIYEFFKESSVSISDKTIARLVAQTLDADSPRIWYWALMDYGSYLKKRHGNVSKQSKSYITQSPFEGSRRQVRGAILKALRERDMTHVELSQRISDTRLDAILIELVSENLIFLHRSNDVYSLDS